MAKGKFQDRGLVDERDQKKIGKEGLKNVLKLFSFIKPYKFYFITGLFCLIFSSSTTLVFPYITGKLIDVSTGKIEGPFSDMNSIALGLFGVLLVQSLFSYFRIVLFAQVSERAMADVRYAVFERTIQLPISFLEKRRVGEITSRISNDVSQLQDVLSITLAEFFRQFFTLVIGTVFILITSLQLTVFMMATFPVLIIAAIVFGKSIRKKSKQTTDELAKTNVVVEETLQNIQVVKAFTGELFEALRYRNALDAVVQQALKAGKARAAFVSFIIFALFGGVVGVLWYGAGLVSNGSISIGELTSFILYTGFIGASVGGMGDLYSQLQKTVGASERLLELLQEPLEENGILNQSKLNLQGNISFQKVSFAYPSRPEIQVLKQIQLEVKSGEKIALLGHSGAGKSTITQLLMGFYPVLSGEILIDGIRLESHSLKKIRQEIGLVPQEVLLFGGTIEENIAYGKPEASSDEIRLAAQKAHALEFIDAFPDGMKTLVGERGVKLSGGQRQRIAIARAILKDPAILILDEATSALDSESEYWVQLALETLMKNRTTIIIAHRLATIKGADRLYVLENGEIVESGTHDVLSQKEDGVYQKFIQMQQLSAV